MKAFSSLFLLTLLVFLSVFVFDTPALAVNTKITPQQGQQYVQSCKRNAAADPNLQGQTGDIFCQCTGNFMMKNLVFEDLKAMGKQDQAGRLALNKMIVGVYAPCMEFPVRSMVFNKCKTDIGQTGICSCLSENMAKFTAQHARTMLPRIFAKTPNAVDPVSAMVQDPAYIAQERQIAKQCLINNMNKK
jgi:hypothetical protein